MLDVGSEFGILQTVTMCPPDDIEPLRERFGDRIAFNGMIMKKTIDESDDTAFRNLDRFLNLGIKVVKLWSAPRGRERGLLIDAPWRIEAVKRARSAGVRMVMVHVADPDVWFRTVYADASRFGTKADQYVGLEKMMNLFPDMIWIGAHMAGDPEHPDHLQALLETYPYFYIDTSATKWQVREVSPRAEAHRQLITRFPDRFLFGTDLVTRHFLEREHYVSRYWCQRTLWESTWSGPSPIADADYKPTEGGQATPMLHGVGLPDEVLEMVCYRNAQRLLNLPAI
jgi:predicted TIM-barrel fold metal-dependent hydrolase